MTLRRRLLLGLVAALAVFVLGAIFIVASQRQQLYDQVDTQLASTPLPPRPTPGSGPSVGDPVSTPISDLYLGWVERDGSIKPFIEGQRLKDRPDLAALLADPPKSRSFSTVDGVDGISVFRVLWSPGRGPEDTTVLAVPLDNVRATVNRLLLTLVVVGAALGAMLGAIGLWISRLGLAPIVEITETADAIAGGDRSRRAGSYDPSTEAGRMAAAFNLMLDERDEAEGRLRRFVSDASHELRTPLTSIRGYLDLYQAGGFRGPGELDDAVRRMSDESTRMHRLVEDLLTLAKLDEATPPTIETIDVGPVVDQVGANATVTAPERTITVETEPGLVVDADRNQLHQVIAGLVTNALTHTPADTTVRIGARRAGGSIVVQIADDGPGMEPDVAAKVFDRFYRGDASRARTTGGSGLGLSIAAGIVDAHGGTIELDTAPGAGTTFTITLPAARPA